MRNLLIPNFALLPFARQLVSPKKMNVKTGLILIFLCLLAFNVEATELLGKKFSNDLRLDQTRLVLRGVGLKTYFKIKVFVAGFYLGEGVETSKALDDVPKRIEIAYFYNIPGKRLAVETRRLIKLNTTTNEFTQIKNQVDMMNDYFVDLKVGDRYALTYIPQVGTQFSYNGKVVGIIEGADFAKALFAVWVGEHPISSTLKNNFLNSKS